jgi:hypothetical protein
MKEEPEDVLYKEVRIIANGPKYARTRTWCLLQQGTGEVSGVGWSRRTYRRKMGGSCTGWITEHQILRVGRGCKTLNFFGVFHFVHGANLI